MLQESYFRINLGLLVIDRVDALGLLCFLSREHDILTDIRCKVSKGEISVQVLCVLRKQIYQKQVQVLSVTLFSADTKLGHGNCFTLCFMRENLMCHLDQQFNQVLLYR